MKKGETRKGDPHAGYRTSTEFHSVHAISIEAAKAYKAETSDKTGKSSQKVTTDQPDQSQPPPREDESVMTVC